MVLIALGLVVVIQELSEKELSEDAVASESEPATLEPVEGTSLVRVTLTSTQPNASASKPFRCGTRVAERPEVVPYGAVIYDAEGKTWVYTNPEPLVFVRAPIDVARIGGRKVFLSSGPPPAPRSSTRGAAELFGAEFEVEAD